MILPDIRPRRGKRKFSQKNPRAHNYKIGTSLPPPPKTENNLPPEREFLWAWSFSCRRNQKIPGAHKICAAISGPRIAGENCTQKGADIHKLLANQFMNPTWAPDLLWIWPPFLGKTDKSAKEGRVYRPVRGRDVNLSVFGMMGWGHC